MSSQAPVPNETPRTDETLMTNQALMGDQTLMAHETLMINHSLVENSTVMEKQTPKATDALTANETLAEEIYLYIKDEFNHANDFDIATSVVKEGIIDSMGILTLVSFLERRYRVEIDFEDITPDNFKNIGAIAGFIQKLRK